MKPAHKWMKRFRDWERRKAEDNDTGPYGDGGREGRAGGARGGEGNLVSTFSNLICVTVTDSPS